jgi:flagellar hook-basal body protein
MATNFSLTALTGINSASTGLGVISNNISNAQTIGFKSSRAEFADLFYGAQNNPGTGARTQAVTQNFSQGAVNDTGNQLDLAISGNGLFILEDISGRYEAVYTRNGSFKLDKDGFITDQMGNKLQGFNKDGALSTPDTNIYQTVLGSLNIGNLNKVPKETSEVNFDMNLNGQDPVTYTTTSSGVKQSASGVLFDINTLKNQQYDGAPNYSTSKVIYDSLGGQHRMTVNYYKVAVNPPGTYPTSNPAPNDTVTYSNETTDWYAQYIMEDFDPVTNSYFKSGSGQDASVNGVNNTLAFTNIQARITAFGNGLADATAAEDAAEAFVTNNTNMVGSTGVSLTADQIAAVRNAASNAFTAAGGAGVAGDLAALQATLDYVRSQGLSDPGDAPDSTRLALLFGSPTNPLEAANAARNSALAMGLTQQQASQSAAAAQSAAAQSGNSPLDANDVLSAFNAAFGYDATTQILGVTPSIPDSVVQAYRFDSQGKLLDFNPDGNFSLVAGNQTPPAKIAAPQSWYFDQPNPAGVVGVSEALTFDSDLTNFTQYAGAYNIRGVTQDGYAAGDLVNVQVNKDGTIEAQYSNGRSDTVAKLALANFSDQQGMQKLGNQMWAETAASGPRQLGNPQASGFGTIQAGALEYSNVDVTGELVNMIFMQKMYQASAQVISTDKTLTQTILQL